jgi:hypothetical protein
LSSCMNAVRRSLLSSNNFYNHETLFPITPLIMTPQWLPRFFVFELVHHPIWLIFISITIYNRRDFDSLEYFS